LDSRSGAGSSSRSGSRQAAGARDLLAMLDELVAFSAEHWDFRHGAERHEARRRRFDGSTEAAITDAAKALGLAGHETPLLDRYDHVLILGGMARACLGRTRYAHEVLRSVDAGTVSAIGGYRPLTTEERDLTARFDGACRYEVDALALGLRRAFGGDAPTGTAGGDPDVDPRTAWCSVRIACPGDIPLWAVAAPSGEPDTRRANTADTCRFWAEHVANLTGGERVLIVTSAIYVPFQHCDAIATIGLPYDCAVETVGHDPSLMDDDLRQEPPTADRYLQELRSALRSMRRLAGLIEA
ncbi:hypothetical protein, partial [Stackebrandtia soli]|uniref:hypothetical protein n=1 Tax=Stackebrandtia soli TaxID=1892856 RepID=UPI0039E931A3